jgi:nucleoside-diphosphate-sugar epimerase
VVFHCAAHISFNPKDFQKALQVNVDGTRSILEAAYRSGVKKVVHLSACSVLGFCHGQNKIIDETENPEINKKNVYAFTKKLAEDEVQKYVHKGLDVSIANIATVYGPGDRKMNSGSIMKSIYEGRMKFIPPGGTSYVAVDDLVNGLILMAERGKAGERYIFNTENLTYKTLTQRIAGALGVRFPRMTLPGFSRCLVVLSAKGLEFAFRNTRGNVNLITPQIIEETFGYKYFSSRKARDELKWQPVQTLEEAVVKAFDYYRKNRLM